jgi:hypothetical protein
MTDTAESRSWAITNVRVFDGHTLSGPRTILVKDGLIVEDANGGTVVDGGGATLLPGLIDARVPLTLLDRDVIDPVAHYGAELVLVRPDQHIAWLGAAPGATDAESVLRQAVAGFGAPTS